MKGGEGWEEGRGGLRGKGKEACKCRLKIAHLLISVNLVMAVIDSPHYSKHSWTGVHTRMSKCVCRGGGVKTQY